MKLTKKWGTLCNECGDKMAVHSIGKIGYSRCKTCGVWELGIISRKKKDALKGRGTKLWPLKDGDPHA